MIISDHARQEMEHSSISEEEVEQCLRYGELVIKQQVQEELRYGKELDLKERKIIVIYTFRQDEERVITTYIVRRKKQWQK